MSKGDVVRCSCSTLQLSNSIESCEECGRMVCDDCLYECEECLKVLCTKCVTKDWLCTSCDLHAMDVKRDYNHGKGYIAVGGKNLEISNPKDLIFFTTEHPNCPIELNLESVHLSYQYRSVKFNSKTKKYDYYFTFTPDYEKGVHEKEGVVSG